jgi:predicted metal-dependent peptidase
MTKRFVVAMIILQAKAPVHHMMLVSTEIIFTRRIPTAASDGVYVYINPDFWDSLETDGQRAFLLAHEVAHIIFRHPQRSKAYRKQGYFRKGVKWIHHLYNISADYIINDDLVNGLGMEPIPAGLYSDKYTRNDVADSVYSELYDEYEEPAPEPPEGGFPAPEGDDTSKEGDTQDGGNPSTPEHDGDQGDGDQGDGDQGDGDQGDGDQGDGDQDNGQGDGDQDGDSDSGAGDNVTDNKSTVKLPAPAGHDYHLEPEYEGTPDEIAEAEAEDDYEIGDIIDRAVEQVEREQTATVPPAIAKEGNREGSNRQSAVSWAAELAMRVTLAGKGERVSNSRINVRRYSTIGVITPTTIGEFNRLSVIVDISASVDFDVFDAYRNELAAIQDAVNPREGVDIVWTNSGVYRTDHADTSDQLLSMPLPCKHGGTVMSAGLEWLELNGVESDLVMVFTDGYLSGWDWDVLSRHESLLVVLDHVPYPSKLKEIERYGIDYIVAEAA